MLGSETLPQLLQKSEGTPKQNTAPQNVTIGVEDMPPQNMPLWCTDYFEP